MVTDPTLVRQRLAEILLYHLDERLRDAEAAILAADLDAAAHAVLMAHAVVDDLDAVLHTPVVVEA